MAREPSGGYMDGIPVKISEKYKPPPKISLAMTYAQRLTLNKQMESTIPQYEFVLEKTVIEKMKEWRNVRSVMSRELSDRLEKARARMEEEEVKAKPDDLYLTSQNMLMPTNVNTFSNILTPIPLKQTAGGYKPQDKSPFNISDFEADTSSPFDNMELKSINDMEELAQVLKGEDSKLPLNYPQSTTSLGYSMIGPSSYTYSIPSTTSFVQPTTSLYNTNGYYYPPENNTYPTYTSVETSLSTKSVPDIIKTLQNELHNTHLDNKNGAKSASVVFPKAKMKNEDLTEFFALPKSLQDMSKSISSMGFPLARVARVCKVVGDDQKKVVDHLLAMSELLDLGFPENRVSTALLQCDNDRDKALDILIS